MNYTEVKTMLESTGLPVCYYQWVNGTAPDLPYICYYFPNNNPETADNKIHHKIEALAVELYTESKDFATEQLVESVLDTYELPYSRSEQYIEDENMYEVLFEMEVPING